MKIFKRLSAIQEVIGNIETKNELKPLNFVIRITKDKIRLVSIKQNDMTSQKKTKEVKK